MSVGDVDGDGEYEYVVKWDPSNSKDVSQVGYTGPVYIDTYRADGTLLHRLDLGVNIRAGAHYTQFLVYDFDGDGRSEMMLKTAPGTKMIRYDKRRPGGLRALHHDAAPGPAGRLLPHRRLPAERGRLLRAPGRDVPGLARSIPRWWPGTGRRRWRRRSASRPRYDYPLSRADAEALADYFIDVYAPSRSARNQLRELRGLHRRRAGVPDRLRRRHRSGAADRPLQAGPARRRADVGRLRAGPDRAGQPGRPVPGRRGVPRRQAPVGGLRPRLLHPHAPWSRTTGTAAGCTSAGTSTAAGRR